MADNRIAVVTGASKGLGLECCRMLLDRGYEVVLTARTDESLKQGLDALEGRADVHGAILDAQNDDSVEDFFESHIRRAGRLDVLINNAGRWYPGDSLGDVSETTLAEAFDNNTLSAFRMIRRALPLMNEAGYGRIVNVSSGLGQLSGMGGGSSIAYRISKTAMNALTRIAAAEAGPNVKVNSVSPGWVRTDMGGPHASRSLEQGASSIVWAATLPDDGPTGGFFRDGQALDW